MTEPIKSDQAAYASSPYLNAYLQKQRLAKASGAQPPVPPHRERLARGNVVAYDAPPQKRARSEQKNSEAPSERSGFSGSRDQEHGDSPMEDRPIDRLHQFEAERGMGEWSEDGPQEGDPNPYDDSSDDTPHRGLKAAPDPDER